MNEKEGHFKPVLQQNIVLITMHTYSYYPENWVASQNQTILIKLQIEGFLCREKFPPY